MKPDSLLEAAKKLAAALEMPWSSMQKTYRELQEQDEFLTSWLPKSQGRQIWFAHPNFVYRLLLAIGFSASKVTAHQANYLGYALTQNGRGLHVSERPSLDGTEFMSILTNYIFNRSKADEIEEVEFDGGEKTVLIRLKDGTDQLFKISGSHEFGTDDDLFESGIVSAIEADTSAVLNAKLAISGQAFQDIASSVSWRDQSNPPFFKNPNSVVGASD